MPMLLAGAAALAGLLAVSVASAGAADHTGEAQATVPDRAALETFAGEYEAGTIVITVTLQRDGSLTMLFPGQQLYGLVHEGGTRYRIRELRAGFGVEFVRDAEGRVTGITVRQPPPQRDFSAPRKGGPGPASASSTARTVPVEAPPPARPGVPPAAAPPTISPASPAPPAPAAPAAASSVAPPGFQRVTFIEGATLDLPADWKVYTTTDRVLGETQSFSAQPGSAQYREDLLVDGGSRLLREYFRTTADASLQSWARARWRQLRVRDFDVPGGKAIELRNPTPTDTTALYAIEIDGLHWLFQCQATTEEGLRTCASTLQTLRVLPGAKRTSPPANTAPTPPPPPVARPVVTLPATQPPSSITSATAPLVAAWAKDPRLASLKAEDRDYALEEAAGHVLSCDTNVTLGNFYDCPCLGTRFLDARLAAGFERTLALKQELQPGATVLKVDTTKLTLDVYTTKGGRGVTSCIAPDKIAQYAAGRTKELLPGEPDATKERVAACTGSALVRAYQAKPVPEIAFINTMFTEAVISCRRPNR